ncbi:MAG: Flp family type IVb pilin [Bacteroidota bacterium]|jgi:pilus assembly protein Flp/PilA
MNPNMLTGLWEDESGAAAIEYGVIAAVLSLVVVTAISATGNSLSSVIGKVITELDSALGG